MALCGPMPRYGARAAALLTGAAAVNRESRAYGAFETKARRKPGRGVKYD